MFLNLQLAFSIMPHTFSLPDELELFREHLLQQKQQRRGVSSEGGAADPMQDDSSVGGTSSSGAGSGTPSVAEDPASEDLWILKTAQHLGKGLKLMTADEVGKEAGRRS